MELKLNFKHPLEDMAQDPNEKKEEKDDFTANANEIEDGLWLGSEDAAHSDIKFLKKHNIGLIIVAGFGISMIHENNKENYKIEYHRLKCIDLPVYNITNDIISAIKKIEEFEKGLNDKKDKDKDDKDNDKTPNGNILIHCARGKSRSASIMIGYLMYKHKISFEEAYYRVKQKRKIISINHGFEKQLKEFDIKTVK